MFLGGRNYLIRLIITLGRKAKGYDHAGICTDLYRGIYRGTDGKADCEVDN